VERGSVLIVEDEAEIGELIRFHAERDGFQTRWTGSGLQALQEVESARPDLIVLDIMLNDLDGLEVCRRLKRNAVHRDIPILILSARGEESDVVAGLELGADDYVTKPFSPRILVARMKSVMRRASERPTESLDDTGIITAGGGSIRIDPARHVVVVDGDSVEFTLTEFKMLQYLAMRPGFVRTRDQIVSSVHGEGAVLSSRAVDVHIAAVRRKLGPRGDLIETIRGVGYRLAEQSPAEGAAHA